MNKWSVEVYIDIEGVNYPIADRLFKTFEEAHDWLDFNGHESLEDGVHYFNDERSPKEWARVREINPFLR